MHRSFNKLSALVIIWGLLVSGETTILAGQGGGGIGLSGSASPVLKLSLRNGWQPPIGIDTRIDALGFDFVQVGFSGNGNNDSLQMTIPLELRTNVGYELKLECLSSEGSLPSITTSVGSIQASGAAVVEGAAERSQRANETGPVQIGTSMPLLVGPRISAKGSLNAIGNALSVNLKVSIAEHRGELSAWQAHFRISVQRIT